MSNRIQAQAAIAWQPAVQALKAYLDDIGYHGIYKYLVAANFYAVSPSMFSSWQRQPFLRVFDKHIAEEPDSEWTLAACLTTCQPRPLSALTPRECDLAEMLDAAGLARIDGDSVHHGGRQLISVRERYLLIDAAIHFDCGRVHDIYIGPDSYMLLHYLSASRPLGKALDLCSGSGIVGLSMSNFAAHVVSTDVAAAPLALIPINRSLNGLDEVIEVREEKLQDTLASDETFDLIACNPPFVASPPELPTPIYALGPGGDGLDYLRLLVERTPAKLTESGEGFFVVDLPGDCHEPHYFAELRCIAEEKGLFFEAYVDNKLDADLQIEPFAHFLTRLHPHLSAQELLPLVRKFIKDDLRANYYYLTTIRLRRRGKPGLRVFNRYQVTDFNGFFAPPV